MLPVPHEFAIGGVYFPPLLIAAIIGLALTKISTGFMNRYHWVQHFFYPPLVKLSILASYTVLIGTFVMGT